jgi:hypothetical protein
MLITMKSAFLPRYNWANLDPPTERLGTANGRHLEHRLGWHHSRITLAQIAQIAHHAQFANWLVCVAAGSPEIKSRTHPADARSNEGSPQLGCWELPFNCKLFWWYR